MNEKFKKIVDKAKDLWNKYDKKTKIIGLSIVGAVIIVLIVVLAVVNTTKYELLCNGLTQSEAAQIYSAVTAKNIPVKIDGSAVYVKEGMATTLMMQLAEEGLPEGKLTYDIYSSGINYAETDKDKQIKQIQQTQNRLQDTIETIPGVKQAIVNIAQSNNDTYVLESDKTPTTASVKLTLSNGTQLTKAQVNGIVELVAHSVQGLSTDNITVADSDGNALNGELTTADQTAEQLNMKTKYENNVKAKLLQMLNQIYGQGNVNIVVNADIDYSKVSTVTNSYTSAVPNYETDTSEVEYTTSSLPNGVTGVSGAQPAYPNASSNPATYYTSKSSKTTSMLVGNITEAVSRVGGKLNRLTISVILNNYSAAAANADTEALKASIATATGTDLENISVQQMGFSSVMPASSMQPNGFVFPAITAENRLVYIIIAAALLFVVLLTLFLVLLHKRKKKREAIEEQAIAEAEAAAAAEEASKAAQPDAKTPTQPKNIKSIEDTINETEGNSYKKEIEDFADKKPELVAQILKNWLKD